LPIVISEEDKSKEGLDLLIVLTALSIDGLVESDYSEYEATYIINDAGRAALEMPRYS
jgi:hypothetical protein